MNQEMLSGKIVPASGVVAAGGSSVPADTYGSYLVSHGVWLLSFAEWIQVVGFFWVSCLLIKTVLVPGLAKAKDLVCRLRK